ncbi:MAG: menaquinone biosynthesis protein [Bacteroidia bacterium]|nr:menaquinone biosynthesis protein [Bacteroidia bacterium]
MSQSKLKISIVNYFNTLPFRYGIKHSELVSRMDLQEDIPSICAQKLKFNQVDIGLVPVALLPELDNYKIITNYCIGANGKVDSVKLYSQVPLNEIKSVTLDYQSRSSIKLTKVLNKFYWKQNFEFKDAKPGYEQNITGTNAAVVIGDRTFALNGTFKYEFDLAEEWKKMTGLPFVFAAWVTTSEINKDFVNEFDKVLENGINHISEAIKESQITHPKNFDPSDYLSNKISYKLDDKKKEALQLFLKYMSQL